MKIYGKSIIIMTAIIILSLVFAFVVHGNTKLEFYYDISMGLFGGAILTFITSVVGYRVERRQALETFSTCAKEHIKKINRADKNATLEQKIDFYMNFADMDLPDLGNAYSKIDFLFDIKKQNKLYIYHEIYSPICLVEDKIKKYAPKFRWHKDGSGRNEKVMTEYIKEIEELIFEVKEYECNDSGKPIVGEDISNELVKLIKEELNNRYYILMYGEKKYKEELEREF